MLASCRLIWLEGSTAVGLKRRLARDTCNSPPITVRCVTFPQLLQHICPCIWSAAPIAGARRQLRMGSSPCRCHRLLCWLSSHGAPAQIDRCQCQVHLAPARLAKRSFGIAEILGSSCLYSNEAICTALREHRGYVGWNASCLVTGFLSALKPVPLPVISKSSPTVKSFSADAARQCSGEATRSTGDKDLGSSEVEGSIHEYSPVRPNATGRSVHLGTLGDSLA